MSSNEPRFIVTRRGKLRLIVQLRRMRFRRGEKKNTGNYIKSKTLGASETKRWDKLRSIKALNRNLKRENKRRKIVYNFPSRV